MSRHDGIHRNFTAPPQRPLAVGAWTPEEDGEGRAGSNGNKLAIRASDTHGIAASMRATAKRCRLISLFTQTH